MRALRRFEQEVLKRRNEITQALAQDFGKSSLETLTTEIAIVLEELRLLQRHLPQVTKPRKVKTPLAHWPGSSLVLSEPWGRVLVIAPWNFPFQLALVPALSAVAAGNSVVLKPSEKTPATARIIEDLVTAVFTPEQLQVVQGGAEESARLLQQSWDLIFFTGSQKVGRIIAQSAAQRFIPTVLELGGKSPVVVLEGADLVLAARRVLWGKTVNAGQTCVAPDYVLLPTALKEPFLQACRKVLKEFFPQGPLASPDLARIIDEQAWSRLQNLVDEGTVAAGGENDRERLVWAPTVVTDLSWQAPIMTQEIFGPLLPVLTYESWEDARRQIANAPDPLALYVFGPSRLARQFFSLVPAGGGCVNDVLLHFANSHLPFGGRGASGWGQYHGKAGLRTFLREKSLVKRPSWGDWPFRYPPYSRGKETLLRKILRVR